MSIKTRKGISGLLIALSLTALACGVINLILPVATPTSTPLPTLTPTKTPLPTITPTPVAPFSHDDSEYVFYLKFSPDGRWLASSSGDTTRIWEVATGHMQLQIDTDDGCVDFSPDSQKLIFVKNGRIAVWNLSGEELTYKAIPEYDPKKGILFCAFNTDGSQFIFGSQIDVSIWDINTMRKVYYYDIFENYGSGVDILDVTRDGQWMAYAQWGVGLYNALNNKAHRLQQEKFPVNYTAIKLAPNGKWMAAGTSYGQAFIRSYVFIWRTKDGKRVLAQEISCDVMEIDISPDSKLMAVAADGIRLISIPDKKVINHFPISNRCALSVALSPKGDMIAAVTSDRPNIIQFVSLENAR